MKFLVSGGGTAGHVYPALAVGRQLELDGHIVAFVGTPNGLEGALCEQAGMRFLELPSRGFDRSRPWTLLTAVLRILASTLRALGVLSRERPDAVVGFGAYVTVPLGLAARLTRVPLVLHEQNSVPGMANRLLARWARVVAVTYDGSALRFAPSRVVVTGNPVRSEVLESTRARGRARLGVPEDSRLLLVFGGSRGARHLNSALVSLAPELLEDDDLVIIHATGALEFDSVKAALSEGVHTGEPRYRVVPYLTEMGDAIAAADLVVCRSGATTLAEITALGAPAVLVPYPYATDDHQTGNAAALVEAGAALLFADRDIDSAAFADAVVGLLRDADARATMASASRKLGRPEATTAIAKLVEDAARIPLAARSH